MALRLRRNRSAIVWAVEALEVRRLMHHQISRYERQAFVTLSRQDLCGRLLAGGVDEDVRIPARAQHRIRIMSKGERGSLEQQHVSTGEGLPERAENSLR